MRRVRQPTLQKRIRQQDVGELVVYGRGGHRVHGQECRSDQHWHKRRYRHGQLLSLCNRDDRPCDGSTRPFPSRRPESVDRSGNEGHRDKFHHYDRVVEPQAVENDR